MRLHSPGTWLLWPREIIWLVVLLALGVSFRLIKISQPFIDAWSWRQSDVAMIAENFYRHGFRLFYPQINWAGNGPGYVGTEFQLVPFITSLFYIYFGVHEWIGRAVSVLFFAVSVPFFYLLVRKISNERSALLAVGIYICTPLGIYASRSFMPDMASLSLSIAALYLFAEWLERGRAPWLFTVVCLATSLAILVKLPAVIIGLPLLYMAWKKYGARWMVRRELWAFAALSLLLPLAWYVHAYFLSIRHFPYHFFGAGGIQIKDLGWYMGILHWTVTESLTPIVFGAMLIGSVLPSHATFGRVFHWWLMALLLFVFLAGEGNRHQWYQLPIVPVAAAFAGLACDFALRTCAQLTGAKIAAVLCCIFYAALAYLSYSSLKPLYEPQPQRIQAWQVGNALNHITPADALVIVADDGDPTAIYYSRRKGWHFLQDGMFKGYPLNSQQAIMQLEKWRAEGANYLGFTQYAFWWFNYYKGFQEYLDARYWRVRETKEYLIFSLK
jgi:4-amino-4-deoxy-L-arabinose transferase-like glycosyltransferase